MALSFLPVVGAMCAPAAALEPDELPFVKANGSRTASLEQAAQSWRDDREFQQMNGTGGLGQINAEYAYARGFTGRGVKVGVFDTGVYGKHPEFAGSGKLTGLKTEGRYAFSYKNYYKAGDRFSFRGDDPLNGTGLVDPQFHGTHVAGIVAANRDGKGMHGVAFNANLFAAITSDPGPEDGVVAGNDANAYSAGFAALKASGVRVINNSWGIGFLGTLGTNPSAKASQTDTMQQYFSAPNDGTMNAAAATARSGILLVKTAGNKFGSQPDSLGALPYFRPDLENMWITAANLSGTNLNVSSSICGIAKYYCISAPGTAIYSARYTGDKSNNAPGYTPATGTSMSAPMIAGSLALLMERFPYMTNELIRDTLLTTAQDLGASGVDKTFGWGLVDLGKAMKGPGQFLGSFGVTLPAEAADLWSNDISDATIRSRKADDLAEIASLKQQYQSKKWANGDRVEARELAQLEDLIQTHEAAAKTRASDPLTGKTYVGSLEKRGDGTLTLAGRNSYSGSTWVRAGRLVLTGSLTSDTTVDGSGVGLSFVDPSGRGQEAASQPGVFVVDPGGKAADISVRNGGTAVVNGRAGDVEAGPGGLLKGVGNLASLAALSGSAIAPGNSIGTLNVAGTVRFAPGSSYRVEVARDGRSDRIATSGAAQLDGGAVAIALENAAAPLSLAEAESILDQRYTILTAQGGVKGAFAEATPSFVFLKPKLDYQANAVGLRMERNETKIEAVAANANQQGAGAAVETLGPGNRVFEATVTADTPETARSALQALSGEVHGSVVGAQALTASFLRDTLASHALGSDASRGPGRPDGGGFTAAYAAAGRSTPETVVMPGRGPTRYGLWGQSFGAFGRTRADGALAGSEHRSGGLMVGVDGELDNGLWLGAAAGYAETHVQSDVRRYGATIASPFAAIYGGYGSGPVTLRLGLLYADNATKGRRTVSFAGFANQLTSEAHGGTAQGSAELSYKLPLDRAFVVPGPGGGTLARLSPSFIEPFLGASFTQIASERFTERGGPAALTSFARTAQLGDVTLGARAELALDLNQAAPVLLRGMLGYRQTFGDVVPRALLAFGASPRFKSAGVPLDRHALLGEAGIHLRLGDSITLAATYSIHHGQRTTEQTGKGTVTYRW